MVTERSKVVLQDVARALSDAEAQLPAARELIRIMREANEDVIEVQALMTEIEARIRQWRRVLEREGVEVAPPPSPETG